MALGDVALAEAVELVRRELEDAIERGRSSSLAFEAGPIEMEFEVEFRSTGGGEAGVKAWVVNLGAKGEVTRSTANRVTVTLQPVNRTTRAKSLIGDVGKD